MVKRGFIAGNFDVIHPGYIKMFKKCKEICNELVIFLHTDPSIENSTKSKPIFSSKERKELLESIEYIDHIEMYTYESELYNLIKDGNFNLRFLGDEYKNNSFTGDDLDIDIYYIDRSHGWDASKYKKLIAESINSGSNSQNCN